MSKLKGREPKGILRIFRTIELFWEEIFGHHPPYDPLLLQYALREERLQSRDMEALLGEIPLWSTPEFQVQRIPMPQDIPDEYIGVEMWWCGGKLISRVGLKIQSEYVEKRIVCSIPLDPATP